MTQRKKSRDAEIGWSDDEIRAGLRVLDCREKLERETAAALALEQRIIKRKSTRRIRTDRFAYTFPLQKTTRDPIERYIVQNAWLHTPAKLPDGVESLKPEEILAHCSHRTERILASLMGENAYQLAGMVGLSKNDFFYGVYPIRFRDLARMRIIQVGMLAHLNTIREHLSDLERELWVAMQMAHDPRLTGKVTPRGAARRYTLKREKSGHLKRNDAYTLKPQPGNRPAPVFLPTRILAQLDETIMKGVDPQNDGKLPREIMNLPRPQGRPVAPFKDHLDPSRVVRSKMALSSDIRRRPQVKHKTDDELTPRERENREKRRQHARALAEARKARHAAPKPSDPSQQ